MANETQHSKDLKPAPTAPQHDDDVIVVPKGSSKARFLMTCLLVVIVLTTFTVSNEVVGCFTGQQTGGSVYMTWNHPTKGAQSMSVSDFVLEKQQLNKLWTLMISRDQKDQSDEDTASFILWSALAEDAGVHVTDAEINKILARQFGSKAVYDQVLAGSRIGHKEFEATLRRLMAVQRFQGLMSAGLMTADPLAVEKLWKTRHQEYAFEYVEQPVAALEEQARAEVPDDAALKAWFDALPQFERDSYKTEPKASAELAVLPLEGEVDTTALFAKYPRPADEDLETIAREYHQSFSYTRFRNKQLAVDRVPKPEDLFMSYEQAAEMAKKEAPIYKSLSDWQLDLGKREANGETIVLADEAKALGLITHVETTPKSQNEWAKLEQPWAGRYIGEALIFNGEPGKLLPSIVVDDKSLSFARVTAKEEGKLPEFEEIKPKVVDAWVKKHAGELAVKKLEPLRDQLGTRPDAADTAAPPFRPEADAEKFAAVASAAGYEVKKRDWLERGIKPAPDAPPGEFHLQQATNLYSMKEGSVAPAVLARDGQNAYLVRVVGLRDPDTSKITAADMQTLGAQVARENMTSFASRTFRSPEYMKSQYGLQLESWKEEKQAN